jgi:hypothetical protein
MTRLVARIATRAPVSALARVAVIAAALSGTASAAAAQVFWPPVPASPPPRPVRPAVHRGAPTDTPAAELAVFGGLWDLTPSGPTGVGARLTIRRSGWLGAETSVEVKPRDPYAPAYRLVIVNARALLTNPENAASVVVTAGGAVGVGLHRALSPMVGLGAQTAWIGGLLAARAEVQYFPGGPLYGRNSARALIGFAVALRH